MHSPPGIPLTFSPWTCCRVTYIVPLVCNSLSVPRACCGVACRVTLVCNSLKCLELYPTLVWMAVRLSMLIAPAYPPSKVALVSKPELNLTGMYVPMAVIEALCPAEPVLPAPETPERSNCHLLTHMPYMSTHSPLPPLLTLSPSLISCQLPCSFLVDFIWFQGLSI